MLEFSSIEKYFSINDRKVDLINKLPARKPPSVYDWGNLNVSWIQSANNTKVWKKTLFNFFTRKN